MKYIKKKIIIQFNSSNKKKSQTLEFHDLSIPPETAVLRCGGNRDRLPHSEAPLACRFALLIYSCC